MENPTDTTTHDSDSSGDRRPLGYWLRVVDRQITEQFRAAFAADGVTRRDWMMLNVLAGTVDAPGLAERLQRGGKHLRRLADRGWVSDQDGTWTLTDEGRTAQARLGETVDAIRARVSGAVPAADFATTMASLEAIARELGWDETSARELGRGGRGRHGGRGFGGRRGFGFGPFGPGEHGSGPGEPSLGPGELGFGPGEPSFGPGAHGFGPGAHGFGHRAHGFGHGARGHGHGNGERCGDRHEGHKAESAYERGFQGGFAARTSDATSA